MPGMKRGKRIKRIEKKQECLFQGVDNLFEQMDLKIFA